VVPVRDPFRIAVRVGDLTLLFLDSGGAVVSSLPLHGKGLAEATSWIRAQLAERGADGRRYTLARHYVIPPHPVGDGAAFDTTDRVKFEELSRWFGCAAEALTFLRTTAGAGEVRCWPHHFDIATSIDMGNGRSIGLGLEPGDVYYDEPYFYVNMYPEPPAGAVTARLDGAGTWHTREWIGAVLPGSCLAEGNAQRTQIGAFLESAISAARSLSVGPH